MDIVLHFFQSLTIADPQGQWGWGKGRIEPGHVPPKQTKSTLFIRNGGPVHVFYQYFVQERCASPQSLSIFCAGTVGQSPEFNNILCRNSQPGPGVYQYFVQERWASPRSLSIFCAGTVGQSPEFIGSIANVTISQGRDASFACSVKNLGGFKVVRG